jgi:FkbM family methyltransferase
MSSSYFMLAKPKGTDVGTTHDDQIVYLNNRNVYILPEVNIDYYAKKGLFESILIEWCKQYCSKHRLFLDIGAHTGTYSISLADFCRQVHCFEPQRATYYALCGGVALSKLRNVICHNVGLGSESQTGNNTLHIVSADGGGSTIRTPNSDVLNTETVEIRTLDSFGFKNVGFIKIDVEDNEMFVLQGAKKTIENSGNPPIMFESNGTNEQLFDYLRNELNYAIVPITGFGNMYLAVCE